MHEENCQCFLESRMYSRYLEMYFGFWKSQIDFTLCNFLLYSLDSSTFDDKSAELLIQNEYKTTIGILKSFQGHV